MEGNYGVITEQGDLGLGFDLLNDRDQKVYSEAVNKQKNEFTFDKIKMTNVKKHYASLQTAEQQ